MITRSPVVRFALSSATEGLAQSRPKPQTPKPSEVPDHSERAVFQHEPAEERVPGASQIDGGSVEREDDTGGRTGQSDQPVLLGGVERIAADAVQGDGRQGGRPHALETGDDMTGN